MTPPFVLVHGAWHAGACWRPLVEELEAPGRASRRPSTSPARTPTPPWTTTPEWWSTAAAGFDEPVLVVGHSLGGLTVPLIPSRRPVVGLVFVAALLPEPGQVAATALPPEGFSAGFDELLAVAQGDSGWTREAAIAAFYHDVPEPLVTEAVGALRTQEWLPTTQSGRSTPTPTCP